MYALIGSHRSGKTTTAKAVAELTGLHYHDAGVTRIMKEIGYNPVADLPIDDRLKAQQYLLKRYEEELLDIKTPFITDRSPVDFIGYMLAEVTMHNTDCEQGQNVIDYVDACLRTSERFFDALFVLRPLPHFEADPTKPPPNIAYQQAHQFLVEGAMRSISNNVGCFILTTTDLERRVTGVTNIIAERVAACRDKNAARPLH